MYVIPPLGHAIKRVVPILVCAFCIYVCLYHEATCHLCHLQGKHPIDSISHKELVTQGTLLIVKLCS